MNMKSRKRGSVAVKSGAISHTMDSFCDSIMKIQQNTGSYTPTPEGTHQAVIVDLLDYGWPENDYQGQPKPPVPVTELVFQILDTNSFGERYEIRSKKQYISWGKRSNFPKFLAQIIGQNTVNSIIETGECKMDELLIGRNVWLQVEHIVKGTGADKKSYAEINTIMAFDPKQGPKIAPDNYVRVCDRPGYRAPVPGFEDDNKEQVVSTAPLFVRANGGTYSPPDFMKYAEESEGNTPPAPPRAQAALTPPAAPSAPVPQKSASAFEAASVGQLGQMRSLATLKLGNDGAALTEFLRDGFDKGIGELSRIEAVDALKQLRNLSDVEDDDSDPFADSEDEATEEEARALLSSGPIKAAAPKGNRKAESETAYATT